MADRDLLRASSAAFIDRLERVADDQWSAATPNAEWDVRALVNHVAGELLWLPPLLDGRTIADVGDRFDGDVLGDDAKATLRAARDGATAAADAVDLDLDRTVHLSFGDEPARQYLTEVGADVLIHTWDLARSTGGDEQLPPALVDEVSAWFVDVEELWRGAGVIGPRPPDIEPDASPQLRLLAAFGRDPR